MREPRLGVGGVEVGGANTAAGRGSQDHRQLDAGSVVVSGQCRHGLIEPRRHEVGVLELCHRPESLHRRTHRHADNRLLGDRGIHDALSAEPLDEAFRHLEGAAIDTDVLTQHVDAFVALHLLPEGLRDRDQVRCLAVVASLASGLGAVTGSPRFHLCGRHQALSVPPPRPGSDSQ